jgi:hypothetical protein
MVPMSEGDRYNQSLYSSDEHKYNHYIITIAITNSLLVTIVTNDHFQYSLHVMKQRKWSDFSNMRNNLNRFNR